MDELIKDYLKKQTHIDTDNNIEFMDIHKDVSEMYIKFRNNGMNKKIYNMLLSTTLSSIALDSSKTIDEAIGNLKKAITMLEGLDNEANKDS